MHLVTIVGFASILLNSACAQEPVEGIENEAWRQRRQSNWRLERFYGKRHQRRQSYEANQYGYDGENSGPVSSSSSQAPAYTTYAADPSATPVDYPDYGYGDPIATSSEASVTSAGGIYHTTSVVGYGYDPSTFSTKVTTSSQNPYNPPTSAYNAYSTTARVYDPTTSANHSSSTAVYNAASTSTRVYDPYSTTTTSSSGSPGTISGAPYSYPTYGAPYGNSTSTTRCTRKRPHSTTHTRPAYYTSSAAAVSTSATGCTVNSTSTVTVTEHVTKTVYLGGQTPPASTTASAGGVYDDEFTTIFLPETATDTAVAGTATIADVETSTTSSIADVETSTTTSAAAEVSSVGAGSGSGYEYGYGTTSKASEASPTSSSYNGYNYGYGRN